MLTKQKFVVVVPVDSCAKHGNYLHVEWAIFRASLFDPGTFPIKDPAVFGIWFRLGLGVPKFLSGDSGKALRFNFKEDAYAYAQAHADADEYVCEMEDTDQNIYSMTRHLKTWQREVYVPRQFRKE